MPKAREAASLNDLLKKAVFEEFPFVFPKVMRNLWICRYCISEALPDENNVLNCKCTNRTKADWTYTNSQQVWACNTCMAAVFADSPILGRCICVFRQTTNAKWHRLHRYITNIDYPYHELKEPKDMGFGCRPRS